MRRMSRMRVWSVVAVLGGAVGGGGQALAAEVPPDITVALDGSGQFTSIQSALESIPRNNRDRVVIFVKNGVYKEKLRVDASFVTIRGESRQGTRIEYPQVYGDWQKKRDDLGRAVLNLGAPAAPATAPAEAVSIPTGSDFVLQNITVQNTAGVPNHSFALYTETADRLIVTDADILSQGNDTLAPMNSTYNGGGHYYFARLNVRGGVDFVCPKGWCYMADSTIHENRADAAVWHNGSGGKDQKFVLRNVTFTGADDFRIARHHVAANFYFLDCTFAKNMADRPVYLVRYKEGSPQNAINDKLNPWGERDYFFNCHREGGEGGADFAWMKDNLETAEGSPRPEQITPAWTFGNAWDPVRTDAPRIQAIAPEKGGIAVTFSEAVTVKGTPRVELADGSFVDYASGSGGTTLLFKGKTEPQGAPKSVDLHGGAIVASMATVTLRPADLQMPR